MKDKINTFKKFLIFEIEDSSEDIKDIIYAYQKNGDIHGEKGVVFKENLTVYKRQLLGIELTLEEIKKKNSGNFSSIEQYKLFLIKEIKNIFRKSGLFSVGLKIILRRIDKAYSYFMKEHCQ